MGGQISSKNNSIRGRTSVFVSSPQPLPHTDNWVASFYIALFKSCNYGNYIHVYRKALIFRGFRELAFIREINFHRKLFHRVCPVHKMVLYKYFQKAPSALPDANGSLSGRILSEAISSISETRNVGIGSSRHKAEE